MDKLVRLSVLGVLPPSAVNRSRLPQSVLQRLAAASALARVGIFDSVGIRRVLGSGHRRVRVDRCHATTVVETSAGVKALTSTPKDGREIRTSATARCNAD